MFAVHLHRSGVRGSPAAGKGKGKSKVTPTKGRGKSKASPAKGKQAAAPVPLSFDGGAVRGDLKRKHRPALSVDTDDFAVFAGNMSSMFLHRA